MVKIIVKISIIICLIYFANAQQILRSQDVKGQNFLFSFGSCFSERRLTALNRTSIFEKISEQKPDVFAWLGDFGYPKLFEDFIPAFEFTKNEKGYKMLQSNNITQIIGVWDDHDYGRNDGDKNYKHKHETRQIYLDYIGEPKNSIRRTQPGGIYTSYYLGSTKKVKLVLLDVRFSRDSFWFEHSDILGPDQWKWLENEFNDPHSHTIILASGCQILPDDRVIPEKWYPDSRNRLFNLIQKHKDHQRVILISGDIHLAEILVEPNSVNKFGYNIIEITSSGLTHHIMDYKFPQFIVDGFLPNTFNDRQHRLMDFNYALVDIKIDPENKENTQLEISIKDQNNATRLQVKIEPWKQEQKQLNLTNSKYTRDDHRYKRWIIWMFKNYFIEYRKAGIALTSIAFVILILAYFICKILYDCYQNKIKNQQKQKTN
ncbi:phosphodiesterase/alkaline phosphatase D-like protein (macronuclear) [Tetrahymena thermophila SB210]|uniref:Phosphodiesterase/alkaline phosphatase D-like protein n=1 Tax=Tetrahymena thermophila (strain SB210) TaxID=312017 RepID=I7LXH2_TETTS|nr:phosphodiesterase/alkaline phosphatase D-like protein [Tetrahymena thermophila SB210]EAS04639.2 phosphodiesterase/alkaline phosphatase D-like protein [Tetrahymena thermophila SB210]|eukprot:XP_001024884.2 phosphodiesterase/alkaline phosphatase D-like protein [Tetrahymena thermophila SB210]